MNAADKIIHIAARRYKTTQKCRRCGADIGPVFHLENGKLASWAMGHRIMTMGAGEAHDLDAFPLDNPNAPDEGVDCG